MGLRKWYTGIKFDPKVQWDTWEVIDPGFPGEYCQPLKGVPTFYLPNFPPKTAWKWRNFGPQGNGASLVSPRPFNAEHNIRQNIYWITRKSLFCSFFCSQWDSYLSVVLALTGVSPWRLYWQGVSPGRELRHSCPEFRGCSFGRWLSGIRPRKANRQPWTSWWLQHNQVTKSVLHVYLIECDF